MADTEKPLRIRDQTAFCFGLRGEEKVQLVGMPGQ